MRKIIISSIVVFSLYSCSTTKPIIGEQGCDLNEHTAGYHIHSKTYIDEDGSTIVVTVKVDNNDECKRCRE